MANAIWVLKKLLKKARKSIDSGKCEYWCEVHHVYFDMVIFKTGETEGVNEKE